MSTNKILLAALVGGIVQFLAGWLIYGMALENIMAPSEAARALTKEPMLLWAMGVSCFLWALMLAWIFGKWAGISTFASGAKAGAIIGVLAGASIDLSFFSMMNLMTMNQMVVDIITAGVLGAIVGGAIGWFLGYRSETA